MWSVLQTGAVFPLKRKNTINEMVELYRSTWPRVSCKMYKYVNF